MKKFFCVLLSLLMVYVMVFSAAAVKAENDTPIIFVSGFLQTALLLEKSDGSLENIWFPDVLGKIHIVGMHLPDVIKSFIDSFDNNPEKFGKTLMDTMSDLMPMMKCNPDGSSVYPVHPYENNPAERSFASIKNSEEKVHMQAYYTFAEYLCSNGYADENNIFMFEYDGRMDALTVAGELRDYIKEVKSYTGADKVRLFGISYGGQIAEAYLHMYMNEGDVEKAILNVPSLGGTNFADRLLNANVDFALDDVMEIVETIFGSDTSYHKILKSVDPEFFSKMLNGISSGISEYAKHWSSVYSLTTTEHYEALKEKFLDSEESAEIIRNNDIIHYEIMPQIQNTLKNCINNGIDVAIIAGSGIELSMGGSDNSDLLLTVSDVTGAEAAPIGMRFADGFGGKGITCNDSSHCHISPSLEIDASTAYLPENTWFIDGGHHAMFQYESYGVELAAKVLCTDELKDVHSDPAFPQFMFSKNPHRGIFASFDSSLPGYITKDDAALVLENIYKDKAVRIISVEAEDMDISFDYENIGVIVPGEKVEIPINGSLAQGNMVRGTVRIKCITTDRIISVENFEFPFAVRSDEETSAVGELIKNEQYKGDTSGMSFIQRIIYILSNIVEFLTSIREFILSDAFGFLL